MARVLVVEDSPDLAFGLQSNLEIEGYETRLATDGQAALELFKEFQPDIVILDLMIPKLDGFKVLQTLRDQGSSVPVVIVSAQKEETAKIRGFRLGADDFVTKPFSVVELMARVEAVLRRSGVAQEGSDVNNRFQFGDIEIDVARQVVRRAGQKVDLTPKAFELLMALMKQRQGGIARREELLKAVWGHRATVTSRTVDVHMSELRQKLEEDPANPRHFITVYKVGYRFQK